MRKLVVTLLAALAVTLSPLAVAAPAQAAPDPTTTTASSPEQAAAEQAAAEKAAAEKAAKAKAKAKAKARQQRLAKKRAAERRQMRVWNRLAHCESTSRWFVDTGNGYYGGLQISPSTWRAFGGARFAGLPHRATKKEQIKVGKRIKNGQGWGAWPSCSRKIGVR